MPRKELQHNKKELIFTQENRWGTVRYYPTCITGQKFVEFKGQKCLLKKELKLLSECGFRVFVMNRDGKTEVSCEKDIEQLGIIAALHFPGGNVKTEDSNFKVTAFIQEGDKLRKFDEWFFDSRHRADTFSRYTNNKLMYITCKLEEII